MVTWFLWGSVSVLRSLGDVSISSSGSVIDSQPIPATRRVSTGLGDRSSSRSFGNTDHRLQSSPNQHRLGSERQQRSSSALESGSASLVVLPTSPEPRVRGKQPETSVRDSQSGSRSELGKGDEPDLRNPRKRKFTRVIESDDSDIEEISNPDPNMFGRTRSEAISKERLHQQSETSSPHIKPAPRLSTSASLTPGAEVYAASRQATRIKQTKTSEHGLQHARGQTQTTQSRRSHTKVDPKYRFGTERTPQASSAGPFMNSKVPDRIVRIFDKASQLAYQTLLGIPPIMNDGNFGQYWITKPINTFKSYIELGLKGGYLATGPSPFLFHYDTPSGPFRCDRFAQYMRAFGLPSEDAKELERYPGSTVANKKFDTEQAKAFAARCGMDQILNPCFRACQDLKVEVSCATGTDTIFSSHYDVNCGNAVGRCHFPGCPVMLPVTDDKKINKIRDAHLLRCDRRRLLFPDGHHSV